MKEENICCEMLRTFADGACEGNDTAAVAIPTADVLPSDKKAADVLPSIQKGVKEAGAVAVPLTGEQSKATAAALSSGECEAQAAAVQREQAFEALIRGEYKDLYDARVSETVRRRLGAAKESEAQLAALRPTAALLSDLLGTDPNDADAIGKRIRGLLENERAGAVQTEKDGKRCEERYNAWMREASELAARYRGFDVEAELASSAFRAMLEAGVSMKNAYFAVHADELLPAALTHAVKTVREQLTHAVQNGSVRVSEEGLCPGATAGAKNDVSRLSRAEREAIIRRVAKGEKISF